MKLFKMPSTTFYVLASLVAYQIASIVSGLLRNVAKAKATGLPYYVVRKLLRGLNHWLLAEINVPSSYEPSESDRPALRPSGAWIVEAAAAQILGGYHAVRALSLCAITRNTTGTNMVSIVCCCLIGNTPSGSNHLPRWARRSSWCHQEC